MSHAEHRSFALLLLLTAVGCQDYKLHIFQGKVDPGEPEDPPVLVSLDTAVDAPPGSCAEVPDEMATTVAVDESCVHEIVTGPLDAVLAWSMPTFDEMPEYDEILMTPVVGHLSDSDGDGEITHADMPDIAVVTDDGGANATEIRGVLRVIAGDGSADLLSISGIEQEDGSQVFPYRYSSLALGDIDADGLPDIVAIVQTISPHGDTGDSGASDTSPPETGSETGDSGGQDSFVDDPVIPHPPDQVSTDTATADQRKINCHVAAYTNEGALKWVASQPSLYCSGHAPTLADLDGDGAPEVIVGPYVLNGLDGSLRGKGSGGKGRYGAYAQVGFISVAADLDGDGQQEVIAGTSVYDADGNTLCNVDSSYDDGFPAVADFDGDGLGEFVVVGDGSVEVYRYNCVLVAQWALEAGGNGGPPTVADFDGDGTPEIGIAGADAYDVYKADGTLMWSMPITDASSHSTGSSVADFEADGRPEVLYADELTLWIFDGATGEVRFQDDTHTSRTLHEYPVVADVDNDGNAEIVVPNGGSHYTAKSTGLYVLGSASGGWYANRQVWNQHGYAITNINDDLSIPTAPDPNWPIHNNFRSGDPNPVSGGNAPDAAPVVEVCNADCAAGTLQVRVRIGNEGIAGLRSAVPVSLYADYGTGRKLLATGETADEVETGQTSSLLTFTLDAADLEGAHLLVIADDNAGIEVVNECNELNNAVTIDTGLCP